MFEVRILPLILYGQNKRRGRDALRNKRQGGSFAFCGIDSPVAGYMVAKRGVELCAVHFYSYPYTSERAKEKVLSLAKILAGYCGSLPVYIVPFTDIQLR
jgi:hypothetical protein